MATKGGISTWSSRGWGPSLEGSDRQLKRDWVPREPSKKTFPPSAQVRRSSQGRELALKEPSNKKTTKKLFIKKEGLFSGLKRPLNPRGGLSRSPTSVKSGGGGSSSTAYALGERRTTEPRAEREIPLSPVGICTFASERKLTVKEEFHSPQNTSRERKGWVSSRSSD